MECLTAQKISVLPNIEIQPAQTVSVLYLWIHHHHAGIVSPMEEVVLEGPIPVYVDYTC